MQRGLGDLKKISFTEKRAWGGHGKMAKVGRRGSGLKDLSSSRRCERRRSTDYPLTCLHHLILTKIWIMLDSLAVRSCPDICMAPFAVVLHTHRKSHSGSKRSWTPGICSFHVYLELLFKTATCKDSKRGLDFFNESRSLPLYMASHATLT